MNLIKAIVPLPNVAGERAGPGWPRLAQAGRARRIVLKDVLGSNRSIKD